MKNNKKPRLLVLGHKRHGKDFLAELWNEMYGLKFKSSSEKAAEIFIYDELKGLYNYSSPKECFEDRVNHRSEWFDMITGYNKDDKARLAKEILKASDAYIGMRNLSEVLECIKQGLFDWIVWVDARYRLPLERPTSFNIDMVLTDMVIKNNDTKEDFRKEAKRFGDLIFNK